MPFISVFINPTTQPGGPCSAFPTAQDIHDAILMPQTLLPAEIQALTPHDCLLVFRVLCAVVREDARVDKKREVNLEETAILEQLMARIREVYYALPIESVFFVSRAFGSTPYLDGYGEDAEETKRDREIQFTTDWEMAESAFESARVEEMVEVSRVLYTRAQARPGARI